MGTRALDSAKFSLRLDPANLLDLPPGFAYRVISRFGDRMDDGLRVPDAFDGMGTIRLDSSRVALVRNHELHSRDLDRGAYESPAIPAAYDRIGDRPAPGGTTTLVYNYRSGEVEAQHLSLVGTMRNCAGGTTPWGSWLSCEEDVSRAGTNGLTKDHGWVFEVPARLRGLADPRPIREMGRFNHEAAAVDPHTGIVYMTEDRADGLFYRFLPMIKGQLSRGGRLQALAFRDLSLPADSRNWSGTIMPLQEWREARWVDLDEVESPADDLRLRGHAKGAVLFARGEGIHFGRLECYFCCTSGGASKLSQVMRYRPSRFEGTTGERDEPGRVQVFVESTSTDALNFGDNLTVAPNGHLLICEDQYTQVVTNHLRGVTPSGQLYPFARLHAQTEPAGVCFAPDGRTMFVNLYSPGRTLAVTGPWHSLPS